jgi:hypothetical protein
LLQVFTHTASLLVKATSLAPVLLQLNLLYSAASLALKFQLAILFFKLSKFVSLVGVVVGDIVHQAQVFGAGVVGCV